jgi:catechol 2,3-dioxygenase-like lactoylglutathione lyase family enzyme
VSAGPPAVASARFAHVNLVARDWERLAAFYERVLGCTRVPPERDLSGDWLEAGTGVRGARIRGIHLRLPGGRGRDASGGPTLEIFSYQPELDALPSAANRPGWGHIAFAVEDVAAARAAVLEAGGRALGELITIEIEGAGEISFAYVADPEGNVIELQRWSDGH